MSKEIITAKQLANELGAKLYGVADTPIEDVTHDSRQAKDGSIFVAVDGLTIDGHRFVGDVMRRGAAGIISERTPPENFEGVWITVKEARIALAHSAAFVNSNPSRNLNLVGITGTNGKTTTTYLVFELIKSAGQKPAMLTTVEYRIDDQAVPAIRTTPEASDAQRFLRKALKAGCTVGVMETSSQAIHLRRCDFLEFRVGVFTNLTRDHLDYHVTMENYFDAKKEFFDGRIGKAPDVSVINIDDEWGQRLVSELKGNGQSVVTCSQLGIADLRADNIVVSLLDGTSFDLLFERKTTRINSPLVGKPHVYNMLSAIGVAFELGLDMQAIKSGLAECVGAPGRFERVPNDKGFAVVVDYAHSDDALLNTLQTARELTEGRIITVFGCGGDRDKSKREPMGEVAGNNSDLVILTSDNPRTEDPLSIIEQIEIGVKKTNCSFLVDSDRREAISLAISKARQNDVVIIAGKGHETYQIIGQEKFHFDDREIALEEIESLDT